MIVKCVMNKTRGTVGQGPKSRRNLLTVKYLADHGSVPKVSQAGTVVTRRNIKLSRCNCNHLDAEFDHPEEIRNVRLENPLGHTRTTKNRKEK